MSPVKVTYYLEILSSWCHWVEPTWTELQRRYAGRVEFSWKIALMDAGSFPNSREQCDWYYRRSGLVMRSPYMLNSGWFDPDKDGNYEAPNLVAEAVRALRPEAAERVRLALAEAGLRQGLRIGQFDTAVDVAARSGGLDASVLRVVAASPEIRRKVEESTAEFSAHQISQRPAFLLENVIGDKAVFSGVVRLDPLAATIDALIADAAAYAAHAAHFGQPPTA